jgi:hypothetical protein
LRLDGASVLFTDQQTFTRDVGHSVCLCLSRLQQVRILFRYICESASPRVEVITERIFGELDPLALSVIKLFSLGVKATYSVSVFVDEADFVS